MKQDIENIIYTKNEDFVKYTKKQRLEMPQYDVFDRVEITRFLLIPLNKKYSGYRTGAFFVMNDNGWFRAMDYDCFSIKTDIENPSKLKYEILRYARNNRKHNKEKADSWATTSGGTTYHADPPTPIYY